MCTPSIVKTHFLNSSTWLANSCSSSNNSNSNSHQPKVKINSSNQTIQLHHWLSTKHTSSCYMKICGNNQIASKPFKKKEMKLFSVIYMKVIPVTRVSLNMMIKLLLSSSTLIRHLLHSLANLHLLKWCSVFNRQSLEETNSRNL
jgi:hypothetical protein